MSLQDWLRNGWLTPHQTTREEIADLLAIVRRDLADAQTADLSSDWRLNIAYNAALQAATAALAACGYRASRESHHFRIIQSLQFTVGEDNILVQQFDHFRKKRNIGGYERVGATSDEEAKEMLELAQRLDTKVIEWLQAEHPGVL